MSICEEKLPKSCRRLLNCTSPISLLLNMKLRFSNQNALVSSQPNFTSTQPNFLLRELIK